ncbi:hypothetical protein AKJ09_09843 [Labilithrix luteola]|uniref:Uncharacterized protein n=1 Tax=Labilithrix luteola TaxID=1391654 RepID=A0A0K1QCM4_9BACT|nr:hypothetical protein [Labilithrix luteola]AKV03180.1 hypothetical protein AKJ09_09843 [Labilithrix luteola]
MTAPRRTAGSHLVAELVARIGAAEFGRRVQTSEGMARHIATARKTPGKDLQQRIADKFKITVDAWSIPMTEDKASPPRKSKAAPKARAKPAPAPPETRTAPSVPARSSKRVSGIENLRSVIEKFDEWIDAADEDSDVSMTARAALANGKANAADKLAKLQGEQEITMSQIVRSKAWQEMLKALEPVFAKHIEAANDFAAALEALEAQ